MTDAPPVSTKSPLGYLVTVGLSSLAVAYVVRKWGQSLPLPAFMTEWFADDEDQDDETDETDETEDDE